MLAILCRSGVDDGAGDMLRGVPELGGARTPAGGGGLGDLEIHARKLGECPTTRGRLGDVCKRVELVFHRPERSSTSTLLENISMDSSIDHDARKRMGVMLRYVG